MKKKTRQVKIKRMWLCQAMSDPHYLVAYSSFKEAEATRKGRYEPSIPLFVLPATAEAYDAMVEQAWFAQGMLTHKEIEMVLRALSLVRPTK